MLRVRKESAATCRGGAVMVLFAVMLVALIGLLGLVIDGGFLMATHRQAQNAADAGALSASFSLFKGGSDVSAAAEADDFIQIHNGLSGVPDLVIGTTYHHPPVNGPYAGNSKFVEVIVNAPMQTLFIHILGLTQGRTVTARAVAGWESQSSGEGIIVLDPDAAPGLSVSGGASLRVNGRVIVNSEAGGVDEFLNEVTPGDQHNEGNVALKVQVNGTGPPIPGLYSPRVDVVGGSDDLGDIYQFVPPPTDPDLSLENPFHARSLPEPDPLIDLITPTTSSGVDGTDYVGGSNYRGVVAVTANGIGGDIAVGFTDGQNSQITADNVTNSNLPGPFLDLDSNDIFADVSPAAFQEGDIIIYPGVYREVSITGGRVFFVPGIYVIAPDSQTPDAFVVGGNAQDDALVIGRGVMLYNTGNSYSPGSGAPDVNDGERRPPGNSGYVDGTSYVGAFKLSKGVIFSPIDTTKYNYSSYYMVGAPTVSSDFDGILFYQRRRNARTFTIVGNSADAVLTGTIYAKWALFQLSGNGSYDAQFIIGSMAASGNGTITILAAGGGRGRANRIYLVE